MIHREYGISGSFASRIGRKIIPHFAKRTLNFQLDRPIVSLSFDDFPKSVMENALPLLDKYNWKATFYVAAGLERTTNHLGLHYDRYDLQRLEQQGHEIGCHTYHHLNIREISESRVRDELSSNAKSLKALGVNSPLETFAYPFGETSIARKNQLSEQFASMRGIMRGAHYNTVDLNQIKSVPIYTGADMTQTMEFIKDLKRKPGWLTLFTHDIRKAPSEWGCTPEDFAKTLTTIEQSGALVLPIQETINYLKEANNASSQPKRV